MTEQHSLAPTVFVVDDDEPMRDALAVLFESAGIPVETFRSARDFLAAFDPSRPGCLVLDVSMPEITGLDLQTMLAQRGIELPVILVSGFGTIPMVVQGLQAGAFTFLQKPFPPGHLLELVRRAFALDAGRREAVESVQQYADRYATLTPREREVLHLLCSGMSGKEIAVHLDISYKTVEKFRGRLMHKMQAGNVIQLLRMYLKISRPDTTLPPADQFSA